MHKDFGEWYRSVSLEPNVELLQKRWSGVEEYCTSTESDVSAMLDAVRLLLGLQVAPERLAGFAECFRKHDPAFSGRGAAEIQVLAGAAVVNCVTTEEEDPGRAVPAGLAITSGSFLRAPQTAALEEIKRLIREHIFAAAWSGRTRRRSRIATIARDTGLVSAMNALREAPADITQLRDAAAGALDALSKAAERVASAAVSIQRDLAHTDEECNMLWWLEGGCSRDLRRPWAELPAQSVPVIAGKELADLTETLPGPHHAQALLHRVVSVTGVTEVTLADAVGRLPAEWLGALKQELAAAQLSPLTPIWLALATRARAPESNAWHAFFRDETGLDTAKAVRPDEFSAQMYVESLLARSLGSEG